MKPLLLALALSAPASAAIVATQTMQSGKMYLSDTKGTCDLGLSGLVVSANIKPIGLCWSVDGEDVVVKFADGDLRIYPMSQFTVRQDKEKGVRL